MRFHCCKRITAVGQYYVVIAINRVMFAPVVLALVGFDVLRWVSFVCLNLLPSHL
jgi:hypothetical protein